MRGKVVSRGRMWQLEGVDLNEGYLGARLGLVVEIRRAKGIKIF